jgi:peroxiredoxin
MRINRSNPLQQESNMPPESNTAVPRNLLQLPENLPVPQDDGAARHLPGMKLPDLALPATDGSPVNLSKQSGRTIVYAYPRTGVPGKPLIEGWDAIPGARGCTPQSCGFRDHFAELKAQGVAQLYGLSTQDSDYQREAVERLHLPFALLSDSDLKLAHALKLPSFEVGGMRLLKRLTLVIDDGKISKVFYPVFPPDRSAAEVVAWLKRDPPPADRGAS